MHDTLQRNISVDAVCRERKGVLVAEGKMVGEVGEGGDGGEAGYICPRGCPCENILSVRARLLVGLCMLETGS